MSGLLLPCMPMKLNTPAIDSAMNSTIDGTGLRIDQAEMFRKFISISPRS